MKTEKELVKHLYEYAIFEGLNIKKSDVINIQREYEIKQIGEHYGRVDIFIETDSHIYLVEVKGNKVKPVDIAQISRYLVAYRFINFGIIKKPIHGYIIGHGFYNDAIYLLDALYDDIGSYRYRMQADKVKLYATKFWYDEIHPINNLN